MTTRSPRRSATSCGGEVTATCGRAQTSSATAWPVPPRPRSPRPTPAGTRPTARDFVTRRFGPPPYDEPTLRRALGMLARRGFDEDTVGSVLGLPD